AAALRARLDDLDDVARLRFVLLVVAHGLRRPPLGLAVEPRPPPPFGGDDRVLLHLVADDDAGLFCFLTPVCYCPVGRGSQVGQVGRNLESSDLADLPGRPDLPGPLLAKHCFHASQIPAHGAQLVRRFELSHRLLNPHPEQLIDELALLDAQLVVPEVAQFCRLHCILSCAKRVANFVRIGIFAAASRMASRASFSGMPSISNSTLPGRTTATHCSGAPLPLPIRVSCGFLVIGLSGNTRTQILPPRAMKRVIATRAASICLSVSQHGSS